jgi:hypothetical protein
MIQNPIVFDRVILYDVSSVSIGSSSSSLEGACVYGLYSVHLHEVITKETTL